MKGPALFKTAAALRRSAFGERPGFVPTMGALHAGHLSLVRRALAENARTVVSVFVNPTQFGPGEDFDAYPRDLGADLDLLAPLARDGRLAVYAPAPADVYPAGFATSVKVGGTLTSVLEAAWRPGHFEGVATVVARLFERVRPGRAYFGLKDYQQWLVVGRMVQDLGLPVDVRACPIVREPDGLAMSSRNRRLGPDERKRAAALAGALARVARLARGGERSTARLKAAARDLLERTPGLTVQYFEIADPATLAPLGRLDAPARALGACVLGKVRLIDNLAVRPPSRRPAAQR